VRFHGNIVGGGAGVDNEPTRGASARLAGLSYTKESVLEKVRVGRNIPKAREQKAPPRRKGTASLLMKGRDLPF
jgi:hypothetical protein